MNETKKNLDRSQIEYERKFFSSSARSDYGQKM